MQPTPTAIYEVEITGGAYIGVARASWPFAKLTVTRYKLQLNAGLIGNLVFKPSDITSIETISLGMNSGIKINHRLAGYKTKVIFSISGNSNELLNRIRQTGFLGNTERIPYEVEVEIDAMQASGGFPLKRSAAIEVIVIWNLCFIPAAYEFFTKGTLTAAFGLSRYLALGFMLSIAVLLLFAKPVQGMFLKPGRSINDIKPVIYVLMAIGAIMLISSFLIPLIV